MDIFIKNVKRIKRLYVDLYDKLYFENVNVDYCSNENMLKLASETDAKICFDINHHYCMYKSNKKLHRIIEQLSMKAREMYFHIADSKGEFYGKPHSFEVGNGKIDFESIIDYINNGVIEVESKDYEDPVEMMRSYEKIMKMKKHPSFDRILMPLPKSAEDFLDSALFCSRKGTIIHFYDFLHVDDFYQAEEKIKRACKNNDVSYRILDFVKCGQHAPRVFRICVDFMVV